MYQVKNKFYLASFIASSSGAATTFQMRLAKGSHLHFLFWAASAYAHFQCPILPCSFVSSRVGECLLECEFNKLPKVKVLGHYQATFKEAFNAESFFLVKRQLSSGLLFCI